MSKVLLVRTSVQPHTYLPETCADPESFVRGSLTLAVFCFVFFFVGFLEGREDPNNTNITISRPSLTHQQNTIYMAFRWCADDGPTLNAGLEAL